MNQNMNDAIEMILNHKILRQHIERLSQKDLKELSENKIKALELANKGIEESEPEKINDVEYLELIAKGIQKVAQKVLNNCPACGYDLGFPAWNEDSPSDEICPGCGIQFGYTDFAGGDKEKRKEIYRNWKKNN